MLAQILLIANLIACGEEEKKEIPTPPAKTEETKKVEPKTEEVKTEEVKTEEVKTEEVKTEETKKEEPKTEEAKGEATGNAPEVKTETKKITSGKVTASKSGDLLPKAKRQLLTRAKKDGFSGVKDINLVKQECKEGKCTGLAQATAYKTIITYKEGNEVAVAQADKSKKNAVISKIDGDNYSVKYDDGSEATVAKSALSVRK